jgi:hypothetical protein
MEKRRKKRSAGAKLTTEARRKCANYVIVTSARETE